MIRSVNSQTRKLTIFFGGFLAVTILLCPALAGEMMPQTNIGNFIQLFDRSSEMATEVKKDCVKLGQEVCRLGREVTALSCNVIDDVKNISDTELKTATLEAFDKFGATFAQATDTTQLLFNKVAETAIRAGGSNHIKSVEDAGEWIRGSITFFTGTDDDEAAAKRADN